MSQLLSTAAPLVDGVLAFQGTLVSYAEQLHCTGTVENLTASTAGLWHTRKVLVSRVGDAIRRGADAVAVHLNFTDESQSEMLRTIGEVRHECDQLGMPLVVIVYPRTVRAPGVDENYENLCRDDPGAYAKLVERGVRLAVELGADLVKTKFVPGEGFMRAVVESSLGRPVLVAGGPRNGMGLTDLATQALRAGVRGLAFGRRVFQADDIADELQRLRTCLRIVFETG